MRFSGELKIIVGSTMFAFLPVFVVYGKDLSVFSLLFGRLLVAAIILFAYNKHRKELFRISVKKTFFLFGWAQLMMGSMLCYFFSIHYSGMAIASALLGISPVVILILAFIMLKERISILSLFAAVIALIGILCITGINNVLNSDYFFGEMLAIASAVFLSFNFILQKKYLSNFNGKQLVFYQSLFQLPVLLPIIIVDFGIITLNSIASVIVLGLVCTVFAYTLIYNGVRQVAAQKIGILQSIEYVMPILFGIIFFNEFPDVYVLFGMGLIILSCVLVAVTPRKQIDQ